MIIREIKKRDNEEVENLIRTCLIEYGANKPGCAWSDPNLGSFFELYQAKKSKYLVVEKDNKIVAGCGIGPLVGADGVCELQKMYAFKEVRGSGIASKLLKISLIQELSRNQDVLLTILFAEEYSDAASLLLLIQN